MTLKEAYYKQKAELQEARLEIRRLNKALESSRKGVAADETFQKQLSHIHGLNMKVSHLTNISERYKDLYEQEKSKVELLIESKFSLEIEVLQLKDRLKFYEEDTSEESISKLSDANAQIKALKEEVARLTSMLNHDGSNTGIPTSKTTIGKKKVIPNSRKSSGKDKGGQAGHKKHFMPRFSEKEITETTTHDLSICPKCGSSNLEEINLTYHDEYDYEVKVIKRRHRFIEYVCLDCGSIVRASLNGLVAPNQYGSTIQAMALSLMNIGFVSVNRTRKIITGFSTDHFALCEGYLVKLQKRYSKKLESFISDVKQHLIGTPLLYWDDTVIFINTSRACMRFYGDGVVALYTAHAHKDLESIATDNILPSLTSSSTVMHDHNVINYHSGFTFRNIECIQHFERDLQKLSDDSGHHWPAAMKELIACTIHKRKELIESGILSFSGDEIDMIFRKIRSILEEGYKEYISDLGHYYESDERALLKRLEQYEDNYFAWIRDFSLPTTNNLSERSLRFAKTKDKISGQFESLEYAKYFADIRTYLGTCASHGINEYLALLRLTSGNPYTLSEILSGAS